MNFIDKYKAMERYNASFVKSEPKLKARELLSRKTRRVAFSSLLCALSAVLLLIGTLSGILDLTLLMVCSALNMLAVLEMGSAYPYLVWAVTSAIAFLILPDKLVCAEYFFFAGLYPIIKRLCEKHTGKLSYALKLIFFNFMLTVCAIISTFVLGMDSEDGLALGVLLYVTGNIMFVLFDFSMTAVTSYYIAVLRRRLKADRI